MPHIETNPQEQKKGYSPEDVKKFIVKWGPRTIAALIGGYYALGVAYELGMMAAIDKIAIQILKHTVGRAGIGAAMPTFQWYTAWGVRVTAAAGAGLLYDAGEKVIRFVLSKLSKPKEKPKLANLGWLLA